jgi:hypothetical protein
MSAAGFLLGFLNVLLYCAVIILIAFVVVWLLGFIGIAISGEVLKWGKIVVGLLCLIAVVAWLLGAVGGISTPHLRWG